MAVLNSAAVGARSTKSSRSSPINEVDQAGEGRYRRTAGGGAARTERIGGPHDEVVGGTVGRTVERVARRRRVGRERCSGHAVLDRGDEVTRHPGPGVGGRRGPADRDTVGRRVTDTPVGSPGSPTTIGRDLADRGPVPTLLTAATVNENDAPLGRPPTEAVSRAGSLSGAFGGAVDVGRHDVAGYRRRRSSPGVPTRRSPSRRPRSRWALAARSATSVRTRLPHRARCSRWRTGCPTSRPPDRSPRRNARRRWWSPAAAASRRRSRRAHS